MEDDFGTIIKAAKHIPGHEPTGGMFLNPLSHLGVSKTQLKAAIKDRIRILYGAYISLASFVIDEDTQAVVDEDTPIEKRKAVIERVIEEMEQNRKEMEEFRPMEIP